MADAALIVAMRTILADSSFPRREAPQGLGKAALWKA